MPNFTPRNNLSRVTGVIIACYGVLSLYFIVCTPPFQMGGDEIFHYEAAKYVGRMHQLPRVDPGEFRYWKHGLKTETFRSQPWGQEGYQAPLYYILLAPLFAFIEDPSSTAERINPHAFTGIEDGNVTWTVPARADLNWRSASSLAVRAGRAVSALLVVFGLIYAAKICAVFLGLPHELTQAALALLALTPGFIYFSAAFGNDGLLFFAINFFLYHLFGFLENPTSRRSLTTGAALSVLLLAKSSGLLGAVLVIAMIALFTAVERPGRKHAKGLLLALGTAVVSAGWWYIRSLLIYGDLTSAGSHSDYWRSAPLSLAALLTPDNLNELNKTFWGKFSANTISLPETIYYAGLLLLAAGAAGFLVPAVRTALKSDWSAAAEIRAFLINPAGRIPVLCRFVLTALLVLNLAAFIVWNFNVRALHYRLLYPSHLALSLVVVCGLRRLIPPALFGTFWRAVSIGLPALSLISPPLFILPALGLPAAPPAALTDYRKVEVVYPEGMEIRRYKLRIDQQSETKARLSLSLVMSTEIPIAHNYSIFVHLLDESGHILAQRDRYPGAGHFPTSVWPKSYVFEDRFNIPVPETKSGLARVGIGFYDITKPELEDRQIPIVSTLLVKKGRIMLPEEIDLATRQLRRAGP